MLEYVKIAAAGIEMIYQPGANLPSINRNVGSFWGGQQQTIAIARALTFDPKVVIMDEPTAALAVREVQSVLDLILRLKARNIAVVLISHRLNDVLKVTDRIVVLRHGRAVGQTAPYGLPRSCKSLSRLLRKFLLSECCIPNAASIT